MKTYRLAAAVVAGVLLAAGCGVSPAGQLARPKTPRPATAQTKLLGEAKGPVIKGITGNGHNGNAHSTWEGMLLTLKVVLASQGTGKLKYDWDVEGDMFPQPGDEPTYRFRAWRWGEYKATCTVTDETGAKDAKSVRIIVWAQNPFPSPPPIPPVPPIPHP